MLREPVLVITLLSLGAGTSFAQVTLNTTPTRSIGQARQLPSTAVDTIAPNLVEGRELYQPSGIALDTSASPPILYVSDTQNNRILVWQNALTFNNGKPADRIIGQLNQFSTTPYGPGTARSTWMRSPTGLAVLDGDLYVADSGNNRVLRFRKPLSLPADQQPVPDLVIGQSSLNSRVVNAPNGQPSTKGIALAGNNGAFTAAIAFDRSKNLWLTDAGNARVLRFPYSSISANNVFAPDADMVLGQQGFGVTPTAVPATDTGRRTKDQINVPSALGFDAAGRIYVGDYNPGDPTNSTRVLVFEQPFTLGKSASRIMGVFPVQQTGGPAPSQQAIFSQRMADVQSIFFLPGTQGIGILDAGFNRLMLFDAIDSGLWPDEATQFSPTAKAIIGHATGITGTTSLDGKSLAVNDGNAQASNSTFALPQAALFYNNELFVADSSNHRVTVWPYQNNTFTPAYRLLGQDRYDSNSINLIEGREFQFVSPNGGATAGMALDTTGDSPRLYVSDTYNHRVLGYKDSRKLKAGMAADIVIGQPDMSTAVCAYPNNDGNKPGPSSLCFPVGLLVDTAGNLYVADSGSSRVVRFPSPFSHGGSQVADVVLGQANFTTRITDASERTMSAPYGLAFAGNNGLLVSDTVLDRVLYFPFNNGTFTSADNGMAASKVFGQPDFTSVPVTGSADNQMNGPHHLGADTDGRPYVVDTGNNRVLIFDQINNTPARGAHAAFMIGGLNSPVGLNVNPNTGEIWVTEPNSAQISKYPKYDTLIFGVSRQTTAANGPLAVIQDPYGDLLVAEGTNRVSFYFPGLAGVNQANSLVNRALAPNTIGSLYPLAGGSFGKESAVYDKVPMPKALADVQVTVNDTVAPLYYAGPGQINFVVPWNAPSSGTADVAVTKVSTGQVLAAGSIQMDQVSPGIIETSGTGTNRQAAVINTKDGTVNSPTNPVARGEYISIYATGQGLVPNPPADGDIPGALTSTTYTPRVGIGACFVDSCAPATGETVPPNPVQFSGLSPQFPGVWQINVRVPGITDVTAPVPLVISVNSIGSILPSAGYRTVIYVK